jgi:hypothetical protein
LTYHARGRLLGHVRGPFGLGRVRPLLGDARALHRELSAMNVGFLLLTAPGPRQGLPGDPAFRQLFDRVFHDERCDLYAVLPATELHGEQFLARLLSDG